MQVIVIEKKKKKKNGRESYVSFYTQYGVSSRFLAKRRYFRSIFWSTLYTILWFPSWVTLSSKRKGNTFELFCDDSVTIYIYIYICVNPNIRYAIYVKIQIHNSVYLVVENCPIVGKRDSFETLVREIHLRPDVGEWTRTLCKKLER